MSGLDSTNIHPVACESCRAKKCKCDRVLPRCGQCSKSRTRCIHPQSYRRGFPEGYLAGLEQRLLQTEIALFKALSQPLNVSVDDDAWDLDDGNNDDVVEKAFGEHAAKQTKTERPREWTDLPLSTREQRRQWFKTKAEQLQLQIQMRTGFKFNYSAQQQNQGIPMSVPAPSSSTITPRSSATITVTNNNIVSSTHFSPLHWSSSSSPVHHTHPHTHTTNPLDPGAGSGSQWTTQLLQGTETGTTEQGSASTAEHPDTIMVSGHARQTSFPLSSPVGPAAAVANTWQQPGVADDNSVDMAANSEPRNSHTPSTRDDCVYLSKAQALSAQQARRFF